MRLIDADAFLNQERKRCESEPIVGTNTLNNKYLKDVIEKEPTIDAEPVRHGRWIRSGVITGKCSECGEISADRGKYCSNCGAKMDGKAMEVDKNNG